MSRFNTILFSTELLLSTNLKGFCSGNPDLDRFFIRYAGQNQFRHHIGTTYVAIEDDIIKGFVTVYSSSIEVDNLPISRKKRFPQYPLSVIRLVRLAVAKSDSGRGVGLYLLRSVFYLAYEMSKKVGCIGIVVDAKPDSVDFEHFTKLKWSSGN